MNGDLCSLVFALLFVPTVILGYLNITNGLRMRRVRRMYQGLPTAVRTRILDQIDQMGRQNCACKVLVAAETEGRPSEGGQRTTSHYGGEPYAEDGDTWPAIASDNQKPAPFLIQVLLEDLFPPPWQDRLLVVFLRHDVQQAIRSYPKPCAERYVKLSGGPTLEREWTLRPVFIPRQSLADQFGEGTQRSRPLLDYDPVVLLQTAPAIQSVLAPYSRRPADLLAAILAPNHCGYGFELSDIVQLGGSPVWLQENLDEITCDRCGRPMRFLFQFGDLNGTDLLGDAGVCYVLGCDDHPEQPLGIVQMW